MALASGAARPVGSRPQLRQATKGDLVSNGIVVAIALGIVAFAAGCGGAGTDTSADTAEATITKADFIAQADEICRAGDEKIGEAAGMNATKQGQEDFVKNTIVPSIQGQVDGIRALPVPAGDEEQITAILDSAQDGLSEVQQDPELLTTRGENPLEPSSKLAKEYGLKDCGQG